ncbi:MAG: hypothetical protein GF368_02295 [Candidatus Aenigmarchaeota archaeon]|nr:hypothetical protein [Candidatus Aenigmarchaeota archaeon]
MNIFKKIFKRKKKYDEISDLDNLEKNLPSVPGEKSSETQKLEEQSEKIHMDNMKAKLDLILTDLDNIKTQNRMVQERLKNMEKTLAEMKGIRYY